MNNIIIPVNLREHYKIMQEEGIDLSNLFSVPSTSTKEKLIRKYAAPVVGLLPTRIRYVFTNVVKNFRNPSMKLRLNHPLDFPECKRIADKLKMKALSPWWSKKAVICVSHDVDNDEGARFVSTMANIDLKYGIPTTFNFLTHDNYRINKQFIQSLENDGFEVGLHGYTHDQGLAFRKLKTIRKKIEQSMRVMANISPVGFRSPALSISKDLLKVLSASHFLYDSTFQIASPFYHSVRFPYPYYLEKYRIWELPLMVQDDNYLRDSNTSELAILDSIRRLIRETILLNGVFVINMHPHLMAPRKTFYENFIRTIKEFDNVAFDTTKSVIEYVQSDIDNS